MNLIQEALTSDKEIQNYIKVLIEEYKKVPPPLYLWEGETLDEYRERLRKLVEQKGKGLHNLNDIKKKTE